MCGSKRSAVVEQGMVEYRAMRMCRQISIRYGTHASQHFRGVQGQVRHDLRRGGQGWQRRSRPHSNPSPRAQAVTLNAAARKPVALATPPRRPDPNKKYSKYEQGLGSPRGCGGTLDMNELRETVLSRFTNPDSIITDPSRHLARPPTSARLTPCPDAAGRPIRLARSRSIPSSNMFLSAAASHGLPQRRGQGSLGIFPLLQPISQVPPGPLLHHGVRQEWQLRDRAG